MKLNIIIIPKQSVQSLQFQKQQNPNMMRWSQNLYETKVQEYSISRGWQGSLYHILIANYKATMIKTVDYWQLGMWTNLMEHRA